MLIIQFEWNLAVYEFGWSQQAIDEDHVEIDLGYTWLELGFFWDMLFGFELEIYGTVLCCIVAEDVSDVIYALEFKMPVWNLQRQIDQLDIPFPKKLIILTLFHSPPTPPHKESSSTPKKPNPTTRTLVLLNSLKQFDNFLIFLTDFNMCFCGLDKFYFFGVRLGFDCESVDMG